MRSRDAFELLELGEAIVSIRSDLRDLRLEKDDLRFERDRYKAAATDFQQKLVGALDDLEKARSFYEEAEQLRRDLVALAKEFKERFAQDRNTAKIDYENYLRATVASLKEEHKVEQRLTLEALRAEHQLELRREIIALANDCKNKLSNNKLKSIKNYWWKL